MGNIKRIETYFLKVPVIPPIRDSTFYVQSLGIPVIKIIDGEDNTGWGFGWNTAGGSELSLELFEKYIAKALIGQDVTKRAQVVEKIFHEQNLGWDYRLGRNGLGVMVASMVDIALWDILCKMASLPLWKVLGGHRDKVGTYDTHGGWLSWTKEELVNNARERVKLGYKAIKLKVGSENPADDYDRIAAVRSAVGKNVDIMIDANTKWDLETAKRWGRKFDDFDLFWFEEPMNPLDIKSHRALKEDILTPIALGESLHNKFAFRDYIDQQAVDFVQVDVTKVAGITEWLQVSNYAEMNNLTVYPHTNIQQPIHVQLVAGIKNASVVEDVPWLLDVWKYPAVPKDGYFELTENSGTGTEIRDSAIAQFVQNKNVFQ